MDLMYRVVNLTTNKVVCQVITPADSYKAQQLRIGFLSVKTAAVDKKYHLYEWTTDCFTFEEDNNKYQVYLMKFL